MFEYHSILPFSNPVTQYSSFGTNRVKVKLKRVSEPEGRDSHVEGVVPESEGDNDRGALGTASS